MTKKAAKKDEKKDLLAPTEPLPEHKAQGLLFIGDPHVWSRQPGRRFDADFCSTICGKLTEACAFADEMGYLPVILGDLFEDEKDSDPRMLTMVIRALLASRKAPLVLVGNHERKQKFLTDDTALAALREARVIDTIERSGPKCVVEIDGIRVLVGGTPHDQELPKSIVEAKAQSGCAVAAWISHHDLAFEGSYPGSSEIEEIEGADILVNGHMHKTAPKVAAGRMTAFNPGNITRMSLDCRDQTPAVWIWTPKIPTELTQRPLKFQADIMDLSGTFFEAAKEAPETSAAKIEMSASVFAQLLKTRSQEDREKADDAAFLREDMLALFEEEHADDELRGAILALLDTALQAED